MAKPARELLVRDLMSAPVVTLSAGQSITLAETMMEQKRIRHIPVVASEERLMGLVTHRDLLAVKISELAPIDADRRTTAEFRIPVSKIMQKTVWSVSPETPALNAARLLRDHRFGCLPVLQDGKLVGIVTEADFLRLITDSLELGPPSKVYTVSSIMTPMPVALHQDDSLARAREVMEAEHIRHLPVLDGEGRPRGLLSERDVKVAEAVLRSAQKAEALNLGLLVSGPAYTVGKDAALAPVLMDMVVERRDAALVVEANRLIGIVTSLDASRAFAAAMSS